MSYLLIVNLYIAEPPTPGSLEEKCLDYGGSDVFFWLSVFSAGVLCFFFAVTFHVTASGNTLHDFLKQRVWKQHKKLESEQQSGTGTDSTVVTIKANRQLERKPEKKLTGWKQNVENSLGPLTSWWRWLLPVPWLHKSQNKYE